MIFDTHCHLNDEKLLPNINQIIENAKKVGVNKFLVVGWDKQSSELAIKIAKEYENCYAAVGVHPTDSVKMSFDEIDEVLSLSNEPKVVAIGEIGLDYYWEKDPIKKEIQKEYFIHQINYANAHNLPIIIHNRDAFEDCLKILREFKPTAKGVMHCYGGSVELLKDVMDLGLYIGLDGPVTFNNAVTPKNVAKAIDINRLLVETDSPYLAPHPLRGTVNEPKNIVLVIDEIAKIKDMSKKHLMDVLYKNSLELFRI